MRSTPSLRASRSETRRRPRKRVAPGEKQRSESLQNLSTSRLSGDSEKAQSVRRRKGCAVFTIGHSTRTQDDFVALLKAHGVAQLVDVRTIPRSRHNPQFNGDSIAAALNRAGIEYAQLKALGGLRHPRADSVNTAWRNAGFRGFADYMQTQEFAEGLQKLIKMAESKRTAIMC